MPHGLMHLCWSDDYNFYQPTTTCTASGTPRNLESLGKESRNQNKNPLVQQKQRQIQTLVVCHEQEIDNYPNYRWVLKSFLVHLMFVLISNWTIQYLREEIVAYLRTWHFEELQLMLWEQRNWSVPNQWSISNWSVPSDIWKTIWVSNSCTGNCKNLWG